VVVGVVEVMVVLGKQGEEETAELALYLRMDTCQVERVMRTELLLRIMDIWVDLEGVKTLPM
jgi:hypothetical protein